MNRICVLGLGHIGLPTASVLATAGFDVLGVDADPRVLEVIISGKIHIEEPDLDVLVRAAVLSGKLRTSAGVEEADVFVIAVPTPFGDGYVPDLRAVDEAVGAILPVLRPGNLVIIESTCPVSTTETLVAPRIAERGFEIGSDVFVAYCPERVLPGRVLKELVDNDRVIGGMTPRCAERARDLYRAFTRGNCHVTTCRTAELVKLAENAFRDVNIAFANELSMICGDLGVDVWEATGLANHHPRVNILRPGVGVGGHCIAIDPWFLVSQVPKRARLIREAREVNLSKTRWVIERVVSVANGMQKPTVALLGAAYKADIDDLRESPAVEVAMALKARDLGRLIVVDPHVRELRGFEMWPLAKAIEAADIVVILVPHRAFLPFPPVKNKQVIDACGLLASAPPSA